MAAIAIANTVGGQFGKKSADWLGIEAFLSQTEKFLDTAPLYAMSLDDIGDKIAGWWDRGISYAKDIFFDSEPNNNQEVLMNSVGVRDGDILRLPTIDIQTEADRGQSVLSALDGGKSFISAGIAARITALNEWSNASLPFQYSWATPKINTGNPRLDQYYFQPANDLFNTVANAGWNGLKFVGNTATIVGNSPVAFFSALTGDYDESQRNYDALLFSNLASGSIVGSARAGIGYLNGARGLNNAATVG